MSESNEEEQNPDPIIRYFKRIFDQNNIQNQEIGKIHSQIIEKMNKFRVGDFDNLDNPVIKQKKEIYERFFNILYHQIFNDPNTPGENLKKSNNDLTILYRNYTRTVRELEGLTRSSP